MTTDKRKSQFRDASKSNYEEKKKAGWIRLYIWIKPEWKQPVLDFLKKLRGE